MGAKQEYKQHYSLRQTPFPLRSNQQYGIHIHQFHIIYKKETDQCHNTTSYDLGRVLLVDRDFGHNSELFENHLSDQNRRNISKITLFFRPSISKKDILSFL